MYLLGYDIGSSSVKASLVNAVTGKCVASAFFLLFTQRLKRLLLLLSKVGLNRNLLIGGKTLNFQQRP